jgi:3-keto-disaccharide hydrolase
MRHLSFLFACSFLLLPRLAFSQQDNEAIEPSVEGAGVIDLLEGGTLDAWIVPPAHWHFEGGSIIGDTGGQTLGAPEWIYTKQRFSDFEFTCELRLTGDGGRNTGIYFRADTVRIRDRYTAPSGYEFDAAPGGNLWASVGDWYVRPQLRVYADQAIIEEIVEPNGWNRMTLRARGDRLEYWVNGTKVMDYRDTDPNGSRDGLIGFQIHNGSVMKIEYRNIRVLPLEP